MMPWHAMVLASVPILALALITLLHLGLSRLWPRRLPWRSLSIASAAGLACAAALTAALLLRAPPSELAAYVFVNAGATAALAFGYFNFVNLNFTSLRVRMLRELNAIGCLSISDIKVRYGADTVLDLRLARLVEAGELSFDGSVYRLGPSRRILMIGRILDRLKAIIVPHARDEPAQHNARAAPLSIQSREIRPR
jgi:hypothetical protein